VLTSQFVAFTELWIPAAWMQEFRTLVPGRTPGQGSSRDR
jgi:hypothetical protein